MRLPDFYALGIGPSTKLLRARWADDGPAGQLHRLIVDRSQKPIGQPARRRPRLAAVGRGLHFAPPYRLPRTGFEEQHEGPAAGLEKDRVPTRAGRAVGHAARDHTLRRRPAAAVMAGQPDADIRSALAFTAKPGRGQSLRRLDNRGSVTGARGALVADELRANHSRRPGARLRIAGLLGRPARARKHNGDEWKRKRKERGAH